MVRLQIKLNGANVNARIRKKIKVDGSVGLVVCVEFPQPVKGISVCRVKFAAQKGLTKGDIIGVISERGEKELEKRVKEQKQIGVQKKQWRFLEEIANDVNRALGLI